MADSALQPFAGKKILVAEDIRDNQLLIKLYLRSTGIQLILANEGQEVLDLVADAEPDLILMDIQMPEVDGYDCTRILKERGFSKPIIAVTAHAMSHEVEKCYAVGCDEVLIKPFKKRQLLDVLSRYLLEPELKTDVASQSIIPSLT